MTFRTITACALLVACAVFAAEPDVDPAIAATVDGIRAIDHHAHPAALTGDAVDKDVDVLPVDELGEFPLPAMLRFDRPEWPDAQRALFGATAGDFSDAAIGAYVTRKQKVMAEKGDGYPAWVLDRAGIDVMFANRVALGKGISAPRFRWVPFIDPLLYPLPTGGIGETSKDRTLFLRNERSVFDRFVRESGRSAPATFDAYLAFLTATLEQMKKSGAIAIKSEVAYLRPLAFADVARDDAKAAFERGTPTAAEYTKLQDFAVHYIASEAGRLKLPFHFHLGAGAGADFRLSGVNPILLEPLLHAHRDTTFVFIHGGYPFTREAGAMLINPNVYADFSAQTFLATPEAISRTLRDWLNWAPERVLFGSDAFPVTPFAGWEESLVRETKTARRALAMALTAMVRAGEVTPERAQELAQMVMRGNAATLYGLPAAK